MNNINKENSYKFLKSAFTKDGAFMNTNDIINWVAIQNKNTVVNISKTNFDKLNSWSISNGRLLHNSGKFFSIDGIRVQTNWSSPFEWDQPIINQPEIGYLGFIVKEFNGVLHFLVQAKIEPGNVNYVQLSPTLQATRSNYSQVHKGQRPLYLEYFQNIQREQIMLDQLQSEQGARFLSKRNRNIIIKVDDNIPIYENFIWATLAQLKMLMQYDNLVNMDTRTVISGISFGNFEPSLVDFINFLDFDNKVGQFQKDLLKSAVSNTIGINSIENIISFLTRLKSTYDLNVNRIAIEEMKNWVVSDGEIFHKENKYFKVIGVNVEIGNREVVSWSQPMIEPAQEGLCAFVCKKINGILHFAVQAKLECGNYDIIEFAPTVQCLTGNYRHTAEGSLPFLEYVLTVEKDKIVFDTLQSEEGGRFFREQNRNMIVVAGDEISEILPENYIWMTLNQLNEFIKFNNYLNIQARSLIAAVSFI